MEVKMERYIARIHSLKKSEPNYKYFEAYNFNVAQFKASLYYGSFFCDGKEVYEVERVFVKQVGRKNKWQEVLEEKMENFEEGLDKVPLLERIISQN